MDSRGRGVGLAVAGFTLWVLADASIKGVGRSGLPAYEVIGVLGLMIAGLVAAWERGRGLWPKKAGRQVVRAGLEFGNSVGVVVALRHVPLNLFYVLVFTAPLVIAGLGAVWLGERVGWRQGTAIVAGFGGVLVAVGAFGGRTGGDWQGYVACGVCVACFATNMVWSRVMTQTERPESLTFFSGLVTGVVGCGMTAVRGVAVDWRVMGLLGLTAVFGGVGSLCFFRALKVMAAARVAQFHYTQLVTGALVAYLVWGERMTWGMVVGGVVIVAAGVWSGKG